MDDQQDKSFDATPHRREQAREQGQVARSQDLGNAALLVAGLLILYALFDGLRGFCAGLTREQLGGPAWLEASTQFVVAQWWRVLSPLSSAVLPVLLLLTACGAVISLAQVGFLWLPDKLLPDITRLDPIRGFQRIFSLQGTMRLGFGLLKIVIIGAVAAWTILGERDRILLLPGMAVPQIAAFTVDILFWVTLKAAMALLILAVFDYAFQWWKQEQDLRMSHQEMREELKQMQGDPQIAARRRQVQRQLVLHRLRSAVPKADVIITNPTELALAIQYDPATMAAPMLVAKGAGLMAQQIRRLALEQGIPIVERKPLAQALYRDVEVNQPIPAQLYAAVAEVLAYVYQLKGKKLPV